MHGLIWEEEQVDECAVIDSEFEPPLFFGISVCLLGFKFELCDFFFSDVRVNFCSYHFLSVNYNDLVVRVLSEWSVLVVMHEEEEAVVDVAEFMNQVVEELEPVRDRVSIHKGHLSVLEYAMIAGVSDGVQATEDVLEGLC